MLLRFFGCAKTKRPKTELRSMIITSETPESTLTKMKSVHSDLETCQLLLNNNTHSIPRDNKTFIPVASSIFMLIAGAGAILYRVFNANAATAEATELAKTYYSTPVLGNPVNATCNTVRFNYWHDLSGNTADPQKFCNFRDSQSTWGNASYRDNLMTRDCSLNLNCRLVFFEAATNFCASLTKELCQPVISANARDDAIAGVVITASILTMIATGVSVCCRANKTETIGRNMYAEDAEMILAVAEQLKLNINPNTSVTQALALINAVKVKLENEIRKLNPDQASLAAIEDEHSSDDEESMLSPGKITTEGILRLISDYRSPSSDRFEEISEEEVEPLRRVAGR